ncbi:eukaryotic translation initiation factor 3 subunit K-like isoform X1 [Macadamia integrifolia]|uniref:eukaryotic translation initiation factor 3 subunit K-like isoform X1 n=1 Tax=Macadamia integrifolia TaxID=60698 RepID=UPI001C4F61CC|nr:eukaryotic translation initiation factor 3 subunit K-like isoform X1 [Macadamia integrifolia]
MGRERDVPKQPISYTVEQLVAVNPYNPDILPDLENYVNEQVSSQTYSLDANLCLLRLYQFEPERMSIQIIARILVKALMAMPAPDFSLCLFLIPERVVSFSYPLHLIFLLNIDVLLVDPFCWG